MYFGLSHFALVAAMLPTLTGAILEDIADDYIAFIQRTGSANVLDSDAHRVSSDDTAGLYNVETLATPSVAGDCDRRGLCVSSNGYPSEYANSKGCIINWPSNAWLKFTDFTTEHFYDKLRINGKDYSGSLSPPIYPYFQASEIRWTTDHSATKKGWEICESYSVSGDCDASNNCVSSKHYPNVYGNSDSCVISVASGMELSLDNGHFDTESTHDRLLIDGTTYSGNQGPPAVFNSLGGGTQIIWTTDGSVTRKGWKLCFGPPTPPPTPSPTLNPTPNPTPPPTTPSPTTPPTSSMPTPTPPPTPGPTPTDMTWKFITRPGENYTCHDTCNEYDLVCTEDGWPMDEGAFINIASRFSPCQSGSYTNRPGVLNPSIDGENRVCGWVNNASSNRCGRSDPDFIRICPCVPVSTGPSRPSGPGLSDSQGLTIMENGLGTTNGQMRLGLPDGVEVEVTNLTEYRPFNASVNGLVAVSATFAQLSVACGTSFQLSFNFIQGAVPQTLDAINFTIADLDKGTHGRCGESVHVTGYTDYSLYPTEASSSINFTDGWFVGNNMGSVDDNPQLIEGMTEEQKMSAVTFSFTNTASFSVAFSASEENVTSLDPQVIGYGGRRILFGFGAP